MSQVRSDGAKALETATRLEQLERELSSTRADLERTVQELEAANEELKHNNAELRAMNGALQSANAALETSKEAVQEANDSLARVNIDLENLLASTRIATLFLDRDGTLLRVTPAAAAIYQVRPEDAGQPLANFTHRARVMPSLPPFDAVRDAPGAIEDEVALLDGSYLLRRVLPYRNREGAPEGIVVTFTDVTRRRRAEEQLRESERLYRAIGESIDYGVWVCAPDGRNIYVSESFRRLVGLTQEQCSSFGWGEVLHPDDAERTMAAWTECVRTEGTWDIEHRFRGVDGSWHPVLARGVPVRDESGMLLCWAGINLDLSGLRRAEAALLEAERQYRTLLATIDQGFCVVEVIYDAAARPVDYRFVEVNATFERQTGLQDPVGRTALELVADLEPFWIETYARIDRTGEPARFSAGSDAMGRWFEVEASRVGAPSGHRVALLFSDITERKRAERALAEAAARTTSLLESITDGFFAVDRNWRFSYVNREADRILGRVPGDLLGQVLWEVYPGLLGSEFEHAYRRSADEGVATTFTALFPDHSRYYDVHAYPAADGISVFFRDVTDQKLAEASLREADQRKTEFLATLAHELRNPLAPIRNALSVLRMAPAATLARRGGELVGIMERQVTQLVRLVDDLLDVSRVTTGMIKLRLEPLDLRDVVPAAIETSRPGIEDARHRLVVRLPDDPLPVHGDCTRLIQVLTNILHNACKYTPDGGTIEITAGIEGGAALLRVSDTGLGIAPDMLPKVFDQFTQVGRSLDRAQGGLGLGLALVKRLVEMHGGQVWAESAGANKGSTFIVRLPLRSPQS